MCEDNEEIFVPNPSKVASLTPGVGCNLGRCKELSLTFYVEETIFTIYIYVYEYTPLVVA